MPAPTLVGTASGGTTGTGTAASTVVALPAGVQAGDLILCYVKKGSGNITNNSAASSPQGSYTVRTSLQIGASTGRDTLLYRIAASGEGDVTVNPAAGTAVAHSVIVIVYRGVNQASPFDVASDATLAVASTNPRTLTGLTTATNDALYVPFGGYLSSNTTSTFTTWGASLTQRVFQSTGGTTTTTAAYAVEADETIPTAGATGTRTATLGAASNNSWIITAIAPTTTTSVSTSQAIAWDVAAQVSTAQAISWDVAGPVTKAQPIAWNVFTTVPPKSQPIAWNVYTTVPAKSQALAWNVLAQVSQSRAIAWDVFTQVSKAQAISWHVFTTVPVKSQALAWNVYTAVSKSQAIAWDVIGPVILNHWASIREGDVLHVSDPSVGLRGAVLRLRVLSRSYREADPYLAITYQVIEDSAVAVVDRPGLVPTFVPPPSITRDDGGVGGIRGIEEIAGIISVERQAAGYSLNDTVDDLAGSRVNGAVGAANSVPAVGVGGGPLNTNVTVTGPQVTSPVANAANASAVPAAGVGGGPLGSGVTIATDQLSDTSATAADLNKTSVAAWAGGSTANPQQPALADLSTGSAPAAVGTSATGADPADVDNRLSALHSRILALENDINAAKARLRSATIIST